MKLRISEATGVWDAWLADCEGVPTLHIRWLDGEEVIARPDAAAQRCRLVWATADDREALKKAGYQMAGQDVPPANPPDTTPF